MNTRPHQVELAQVGLALVVIFLAFSALSAATWRIEPLLMHTPLLIVASLGVVIWVTGTRTLFLLYFIVVANNIFFGLLLLGVRLTDLFITCEYQAECWEVLLPYSTWVALEAVALITLGSALGTTSQAMGGGPKRSFAFPSLSYFSIMRS